MFFKCKYAKGSVWKFWHLKGSQEKIPPNSQKKKKKEKKLLQYERTALENHIKQLNKRDGN